MGLAFNKFNSWEATALSIEAGLITVSAYRVALTNTLPVASQTTFDPVTAHPPPTVGNNYPTGGYTLTGLVAATINTNQGQLSASMLTPTCTGSDWGPYRYVIHYVDTSAGPKLRGWADLGVAVTLAVGQQRQFKWGGISGVGPIRQIA